MGSVEEIRNELKGKTGMEESVENDLFDSIAEIEKKDGVIAPLPKKDYLLAIACGILFGVTIVVFQAFLYL
ncbi:hypothetical protein [Anaerovorax odorimutans]|uniref:hypothetical protein n=1 Tax=Anaerovorax odorimutans TaxID=109327 RepID=UPI0003FA3F14|nr:hypothetical protein [Anaerovorax odorimutans]